MSTPGDDRRRCGEAEVGVGLRGVGGRRCASQRVEVSNSAVPGTRYVIAVLVLNGPLAEPRGGIFMRYATLAFESSN